jgi:hypothetical protein
MAHIIPSLTGAYLAGGHKPELETLHLLQKDLSNEYTVFHGVHWSATRCPDWALASMISAHQMSSPELLPTFSAI